MNEIYTAFARAADIIEARPHLFEYQQNGIPNCRTPGCAIGWVGHFLGHKGDINVTHAILGTSVARFACRMDDLVGGLTSEIDWRSSARKCAETMRLYAAKYHAQPKALNWERIANAPADVREAARVTT